MLRVFEAEKLGVVAQDSGFSVSKFAKGKWAANLQLARNGEQIGNEAILSKPIKSRLLGKFQEKRKWRTQTQRVVGLVNVVIPNAGYFSSRFDYPRQRLWKGIRNDYFQCEEVLDFTFFCMVCDKLETSFQTQMLAS